MNTDRREHWNRVYASRSPDEVSWFEESPATSLALIGRAGVARDSGVIDVGAGVSRLAAALLDEGYAPITVLDVSREALQRLRTALGERAADVEFAETDVTAFRPTRRYGLWHDRAVFHFLTDAADQRAYVDTLERSLQPGGAAIIAAFALDGPTRCSGLDVQRYDAATLAERLGTDFGLVESRDVVHRTPARAEQRFSYHLLRRL